MTTIRSHGDTATARRLLRTFVDDAGGGPALASLAWARADLADDEPRAALRSLPAWDGAGAGAPSLHSRLSAGLLEALATHRAGDGHRAARVLERVLELAEPEGFRGLFTHPPAPVRDLLVDHLDTGTAYWSTVTDLVDATTGDRVEPTSAPVLLADPLSDRELAVLRYLQSILSNTEIAVELSVSVNTVKTHVRNLYRKLGVTRRREAVRRAREVRLL